LVSRNFEAIALKQLQEILNQKGITAEALFAKYDIDGNGSLDFSEFENALRSLTGQSAPQPIIRAVFNALDLDNDSTLELAELVSLIDGGKSPISSGEVGEIEVVDHSNPNFNGSYIRQGTEINGKPWFLNSTGARLYFYSGGEGGARSWSFDDRQQDGSNDWYRGGWTRPPTLGGIPLGTRRWVGVGRVTLTSVGEPAGASPADAAGEDTFKIRLELSKSIFSTDEGIEVEFTLPVLDDSAWIGVVPAGIAHGDEAVNDQHDIEFRHLEGRTIGGFTFANPGVGDWSIRLNDDDDSGNELAYVEFTVVAGLAGTEISGDYDSMMTAKAEAFDFMHELGPLAESLAETPNLSDEMIKDMGDAMLEEKIANLPNFLQNLVRKKWNARSDDFVTMVRSKMPEASTIATGAVVAGVLGATAAAVLANADESDSGYSQSEYSRAVDDDSASLSLDEARALVAKADAASIAADSQAEAVHDHRRHQTAAEWHETHHVDAPDEVEVPPGVEVTARVEVPDRIELPDRVRYSDDEATMSETGGQKQAQAPIGIVEKSEIAGGAVPQPAFDLGAIATVLSEARFLNDQNEIVKAVEGKMATIELTISKIERSFAIGLDPAYRGGQTIIGQVAGVGEVEVHLLPDVDVSGFEVESTLPFDIAIDGWNGIRKRLVLNGQ
jgi:hypothetical protein